MGSDDRLKMVQELMKHPLKADDSFQFRCKQCGCCCRDREDILLSPFDLCRMAQELGKMLPDVIQEYGYAYAGDSSKMPLVSLKMRRDNGKCPFLKIDNCCGIHNSKPSVCALFPLGRIASRDLDTGKTKISYILQPTGCGARDETHTPCDWMGRFGLEESEKWFEIWQDVVMKLSERIRDILPQLPGKSGDSVLNGLFQVLYLRYHPEQPVIPQLKDNEEKAHEMLDMTEGLIRQYRKGAKNV